MLAACGDSATPAATPTPVVIVMVVTATSEPVMNTPIPTIPPIATNPPGTQYNNPKFGISAVLPGEWRTIRSDGATGDMMSKDGNLLFSYAVYPRNLNIDELRQLAEALKETTTSLRPPITITETTFKGNPAVRLEANWLLGREGNFRTTFYFISLYGLTYDIHVGTKDDSRQSEVEDITESIQITDTGIGSLQPSSGINSPTPQPLEQSISFEGSGTMNTKSFNLAGGNYTISWSSSPRTGSTSCSHGGYLEAVDSSVRMLETFGVSPRNGETERGSTEVYNIKSGDYYFKFITGCDWTVEISPQK